MGSIIKYFCDKCEKSCNENDLITIPAELRSKNNVIEVCQNCAIIAFTNGVVISVKYSSLDGFENQIRMLEKIDTI